MSDDKFLDALSDVVWRFHAYNNYGRDPKKAVKALARRVPGYSPEYYREMFELDLKLLQATIKAMEDAPKALQPGQAYSRYEDVDIEFMLRQLRVEFPDQAETYLKSHIGMVIYWYYLR